MDTFEPTYFMHPILGKLMIRPDATRFQLSYTKNIVDKVVVKYKEAIVNGKWKDVTYTKFFETEWVDFARLGEIVCGNGYAICRPFTDEKLDIYIKTVSYVGLDFDGVSTEVLEDLRTNNPYTRNRGFFNYSSSHGKKPGVAGHLIIPVENPPLIETEEQRKVWKIILDEFVEAAPVGDQKVSDLSRLFYGAKGKNYEVWGPE